MNVTRRFLLGTADDELCPCASGKKWRRCHGWAERTLPPQCESDDIDPVLIALGDRILSTLKDAIESVNVPEISDSNVEEVFRKRTLLYFAKKVYRSTLGGMYLIRLGQTTQAFSLKRDQHYAWVAFHYYLARERESILFMASGALRQRDNSKKIMGFDPKAAADPVRQKQLAEHEKTADALYEKFPDLKVVKGKSASSPNPVYIDWSEPSEYVMMQSIVATWPDELAQAGNPIDPADVEDWCHRQTESAQFFHAAFPSQDIHGTPMGLGADLNDDEEGNAADLRINAHEPNSLLYIYLLDPVLVARKLVDLVGARGFQNRLVQIHKALEAYRRHFDPESAP